MLRILLVIVLGCQLGACGIDAKNRRATAPPEATPTVAAPSTVSTATGEITASNDLLIIETAIKKLPRATTLVVFDIDDTLLTTPKSTVFSTNAFFGSDWWFGWQYALLDSDPQKIPCLFDFVAMNYAVGQQSQTQDNAAEIFNRIRYDKMMLTSRSPHYREATERELSRWKFDPIDALTVTGFTEIMAPNDTAMTYHHGIYMTKGWNKGEALLALLERLRIDTKFADIVLVDDGNSNLLKMQAALLPRNIRFHGFLYTGVKDDRNLTITADMKDMATEDWKVWLAGIGALYPGRKAYFENRECECR